MTKLELIKRIAESTGIQIKDVGLVVEGFIQEVQKSLIADETVYLRGFGCFKVHESRPKTVYNFEKQTSFEMKGRVSPKFKPYKHFVEAIKAAK